MATKDEVPVLLQPAEDLLGLDELDDAGPISTVEEALASVPDDKRADKAVEIRAKIAYEGVLLLPDDVLPSKAMRMREFLQLVKEGCTDQEAAHAVGYSRWGPIGWKKQYPGFLQAYHDVKTARVEDLIKEAKRRAMRSSDRLLEFLLCNLAPDQFKRMPDAKVDVNVSAVAERLQAGRKRVGS